MDDDTTTAASTDVQTGAETAQPVTDTPAPAADVQTTTEPSEPSQDATTAEAQPQADDTASAPQVDDKLQKYAKSQGLELDSPSAIKAAQIAMKAQSEATRNYQRSSELEKNIKDASDQYATAEAQQTGQDPEIVKAVRSLQVENAINKFYRENPDASQYDEAMGKIVTERPYLAGDFEALYAMAKVRQGVSDTDSVKTQTKRETLEALAQTQQAAVPRGNAVSGAVTPSKKDFKDLSISEMEAQLGFVRQ